MQQYIVDNSTLERDLTPGDSFSDAVMNEARLLAERFGFVKGDAVLRSGAAQPGIIDKLFDDFARVESEGHFTDITLSELCKLNSARALKELEALRTHPQLKHSRTILFQNEPAVLKAAQALDGAVRINKTFLSAEETYSIDVLSVLHLKALHAADHKAFPRFEDQWRFVVGGYGKDANHRRVFMETPPVRVARESERVLFVGTPNDTTAYYAQPHNAVQVSNFFCTNTQSFWRKFFDDENFITSCDVSVPLKIVTTGRICDYTDSFTTLEGSIVIDNLERVAHMWGISLEVTC